MEKITAYFDGACEPYNPGGNMGIGAFIQFDGITVAEHSNFVPKSFNNSNNVAEYIAFIWILKWIIHEGFFDNPILIKGDSMLVVQQMNDVWRIKDGKYKPYAIEAKELLSNLTNVQIKHIYREQNEEADKLSKAGIRANNIKFRIQPE